MPGKLPPRETTPAAGLLEQYGGVHSYMVPNLVPLAPGEKAGWREKTGGLGPPTGSARPMSCNARYPGLSCGAWVMPRADAASCFGAFSTSACSR